MEARGTVNEERQEGKGTLTSKLASKFVFDVACSITFRIEVDRLPTESRLKAKEGHVVHYIRSVDNRIIPNGDYELDTMPTGSASEFIQECKTQDSWEILPY